MAETCILSDGRRIKYTLIHRPGTDVLYVRFRDAAGKRWDKTTRETNRKAAADAAVQVIVETYQPPKPEPKPEATATTTWEEAETAITKAMTAANLRPSTIHDYKRCLSNLRQHFPDSKGPADITDAQAHQYKHERAVKVKAETLRNDLVAIKAAYSKWLITECRKVKANPFAEVQLPKLDRHTPRVLTADETAALLKWMTDRYGRLPALALEVKLLIGCRLSELTGLRTDALHDGGRIRFEAENVKGRADGWARVPAAIAAELRENAGKTYVFEKFSERLRTQHIEAGKPNWAKSVGDFTPARFFAWLEDRIDDYRKHLKIAGPDDPRYFKLHNLRGTAMSRARAAGVQLTDASVAFRCHPETMRRHYIEEETRSVSDSVFAAMHAAAAKPKKKKGKAKV